MLANRTQIESNLVYNDPNLRGKLEGFIKNLEKSLQLNNNLQTYFGRLNNETDRIGEMNEFLGHMEQVAQVVC